MHKFLKTPLIPSLKRKLSSSAHPSKPQKSKSKQTLLFPTQPQPCGSGVFENSLIRIACWNVNGLRACLQKPDFQAFVNRDSIDVLCFNETKIQDLHVADLKPKFHQFPYSYFSCSRTKLGYSGVAILSKVEPIRWEEGLENHPEEGRVVVAEFDTFFLLCTYVPNSGKNRFDYRINKWDQDLRKYIKKLEERGKGVIWVGDLNVINQDIDIYRLKGNEQYAGATPEERKSFQETLSLGLVDSFRHLYPNVKKFSWFSTIRQVARANNEGWRIDCAVISQSLLNRLQDSLIHGDVMGSDHHPIEIILNNNTVKSG